MNSCEERARKDLRLEDTMPLYDSPADKLYRFFNRTYYDNSPTSKRFRISLRNRVPPVAFPRASTLTYRRLSSERPPCTSMEKSQMMGRNRSSNCSQELGALSRFPVLVSIRLCTKQLCLLVSFEDGFAGPVTATS